MMSSIFDFSSLIFLSFVDALMCKSALSVLASSNCLFYFRLAFLLIVDACVPGTVMASDGGGLWCFVVVVSVPS